jgi:hypothetical protein
MSVTTNAAIPAPYLGTRSEYAPKKIDRCAVEELTGPAAHTNLPDPV